MPDLQQAIVVTGTSTGIGRATALLLDREGYRVFAGVRRPEDGEGLQKEGSERLTPLLLDVTDGAAVERGAAQVGEALGDMGLVGLVNNAGVGFGGPLEFVDLAEMRRGYEVNVFGPMAVTRAFLPLLRRASGRIVNVSSGAGKASTPLLGPYCSSKFALEALSDALRIELRGSGIDVSVVEPGFIDTPMQEKGRSDVERMLRDLPEEALQRYRPSIEKLGANIERFGSNATPAETVARTILEALTARRPRTRYPVGRDAKLLMPLARVLPDRAKDAIFGRLLGL